MAFILFRSTSAEATSTEASQSRHWSDQNTIAKKLRGLLLARSLGMDQYQLWPSVVFLAMPAAIGGGVPNHLTRSPVTFASKMVTTENSLGLRALRLPHIRRPKSSGQNPVVRGRHGDFRHLTKLNLRKLGLVGVK